MSTIKIYRVLEKYDGDLYSAPVRELRQAFRDPQIQKAKVSQEVKALALSLQITKATQLYRDRN